MKIKNTQSGPRGINTVVGAIIVGAGETVDGIEIYQREQQHIEAAGWFEVEGEFTPDPPATNAAQNSVFTSTEPGKDGVYIPAGEFNAMRETFERLKAENDELRKQTSAGAGSQDGGNLDREALKAEADTLGLDYARNISTEKLKELIDAKKAG